MHPKTSLTCYTINFIELCWPAIDYLGFIIDGEGVKVDPKKVELTLFNKIERHYLAKLPDSEDAIITDTKKVVATLNSLCIEMDARYDLLKDAMVRNIKEYNTKFKEQETAPGLVFVEGGTFTMGKVQDDVMHDWNNSPNQQHVQSFYMDETEVTNVMYLEYLDWIKRVYPPSDPKFTAIYNGALPDTLVWRNRLGYSEILVENYLRHPAYGNFPVVGVSWLQANEYAKWRSDRVAEMGLQKEGYLEKGSHIPGDLVTATSNFNIDTYVNAPKETYKDSLGVHLGGKGKRSRLRNKSWKVSIFCIR